MAVVFFLRGPWWERIGLAQEFSARARKEITMIATCPHCHKKFTVEESMVGKQATCTECGKQFVIASDPPPPAHQTAPIPTASPVSAGRGLSDVFGGLSKGALGPKVLLLAGLVLVLFARGCDSIGSRAVGRAGFGLGTA